MPVIVPEKFAEFKSHVDSQAEVWCLISAWLPELRPAHEPMQLYAEDPQHQMIYDYVKTNFELVIHYSALYPTYVYRRLAPPDAG